MTAKWNILAGFHRRSRRIKVRRSQRPASRFSWATGKWIVHQGFVPQLDEKNRSLAFLYSIIANVPFR